VSSSLGVGLGDRLTIKNQEVTKRYTGESPCEKSKETLGYLKSGKSD